MSRRFKNHKRPDIDEDVEELINGPTSALLSKEEYRNLVVEVLSDLMDKPLRPMDVEKTTYQDFEKLNFSYALHELPLTVKSKTDEPVTECFDRLFGAAYENVPNELVGNINWFIHYPDPANELPEHRMTAMVGWAYSLTSDGTIYEN